MFYFWIPFAQNVDYGKYRKRIFRLKKKKRKWCHFYYFYLASFHKIIVPTNCSQRSLHLNCNLVLLIIDFQYEYAIPFRSNPRELPSNIDHETIYSQRLTPIEFRDSTRRFNSKKKKRKKKNVTRAKKTRGCNDYPHQELHVYRYTYTYKTHRTMESVVRSYLYDVGRKETTVGLPCCAQRNVKILPRASDLNDAAGISTRSKSYACVIG